MDSFIYRSLGVVDELVVPHHVAQQKVVLPVEGTVFLRHAPQDVVHEVRVQILLHRHLDVLRVRVRRQPRRLLPGRAPLCAAAEDGAHVLVRARQLLQQAQEHLEGGVVCVEEAGGDGGVRVADVVELVRRPLAGPHDEACHDEEACVVAHGLQPQVDALALLCGRAGLHHADGFTVGGLPLFELQGERSPNVFQERPAVSVARVDRTQYQQINRTGENHIFQRNVKLAKPLTDDVEKLLLVVRSKVQTQILRDHADRLVRLRLLVADQHRHELRVRLRERQPHQRGHHVGAGARGRHVRNALRGLPRQPHAAFRAGPLLPEEEVHLV
eukprot:Rhum_TRINITY_DN14420_c18_g1::Rhum_TRINITY_DN14420_c18_g1_i1::g.89546::m.89546